MTSAFALPLDCPTCANPLWPPGYCPNCEARPEGLVCRIA